MTTFFLAQLLLPRTRWESVSADIEHNLTLASQHQVSISYKPSNGDMAVEIIFCDDDRDLLPADFLSAAQVTPLRDKNWLIEQRKDFAPIILSGHQSHQPINQHHRWWVADQHYQQTPPPFPTKKLLIDISLAFGTGRHPTTQLCLNLLCLLPANKKWHMLDVGTGTGILAMAAQQLHRRAVVTMADNDPVAIKIARHNAAINRLPIKKFILGDGLKKFYKANNIARTYDLIFANIMFLPLYRLAPAIARASASHGFIILSGITAHQANGLKRRYQSLGFITVAQQQQGDWVGLLLQKKFLAKTNHKK